MQNGKAGASATAYNETDMYHMPRLAAYVCCTLWLIALVEQSIPCMCCARKIILTATDGMTI
jgi:hypothetical protein